MLDNVSELIQNDSTRFSWLLKSSSKKRHGIINAIESLGIDSGTNRSGEALTTSSITKNIIFVPFGFEDEIVEKQALSEQKAYDTAVEKHVKDLIRVLWYSSINADEITPAERVIIDIVNANSFRFLGEVLQKIYLQYNDFPIVLVGVCRGLERFDYREVAPWGPIMLIGLLNHKSDLVKEAAVCLVENWANIEFLPALRNIECKTNWMRSYVNDVIQYIEDCDVLHKKIIL